MKGGGWKSQCSGSRVVVGGLLLVAVVVLLMGLVEGQAGKEFETRADLAFDVPYESVVGLVGASIPERYKAGDEVPVAGPHILTLEREEWPFWLQVLVPTDPWRLYRE